MSERILSCYNSHSAKFLDLHREFLVGARYKHCIDRNAELCDERSESQKKRCLWR